MENSIGYIDEIKNKLNSKIIGQDKAIASLMEITKRINSIK